MEIIKKEEKEIEFYTVDLTGQSGISQTGLAILAGVSRQAISRLENTLATKAPSESLEPFIGKPLTLATEEPKIQGKPAGNLKIYKSSFCAALLKHYSANGQTEETRRIALNSLLKFAEVGIDAWIQQVTGWKLRKEQLTPYTDVYIKRLENIRDHQIDDNLWMIFREAAELLLIVEKDWRVPIDDYDILDGSIGKRWNEYRKDKQWAGTTGTYTHKYRDQRGDRQCNAYGYNELPYFKKWLREIYIPDYLPRYLVNKYGKQAVRLIYTENGTLTDYILRITDVKRITSQENRRYQEFLLSRQTFLEKMIASGER